MDTVLASISVIVNEILYQRSIYPPESFVSETHLGVPMHGLSPKPFAAAARLYVQDWVAAMAPYLQRSKVAAIVVALFADGRLFESHLIQFDGPLPSTTSLCEDEIRRVLRRLLLLRAVMKSPPDAAGRSYRLYVRTANPEIARQIVNGTGRWTFAAQDELGAESVLRPIETISGPQRFRMAVVAKEVVNVVH